METSVKYQVMPPLSPDEYQELFESIKAQGVLEPIHIDADGVVIDGHHRSKIASEMGIPCPVITHDDLNESEKRSLAFTLNLKRRHLNREQRRALIAESLKADPQLSNREHAERTGASHPTVASVRNGLEADGQVEKFTTSIGADGKIYPATQPPRPQVEPQPVTDIITPGELEEINTPLPNMKSHHAPPLEPPESPKDHILDLLVHMRTVDKALREAIFTAHRIGTWEKDSITDPIRDLLAELDAALNAGGMDAELYRLMEENNE